MIALLQRVKHASVSVDNDTIARINPGLLVFLGVEKGDLSAHSQRLATRVLGYRMFSDEAGKMNRNVCDIEGEVLVVSQFTLAANTAKGRRPSFASAAAPNDARALYTQFTEDIQSPHTRTQTGRFGADMQVALVNDGPVTFWLRVEP